MMDDYKNFDNFQRTEGYKMISPYHPHPTNGVRPSDSNVTVTIGDLTLTLQVPNPKDMAKDLESSGGESLWTE